MRFTCLFLFLSFFSKAQFDSTISAHMISVHFGGDLPYSDLAERFGPNLKAGGSYMYKTNKNWILGLDASYIFGRNVKEDVLANLKTPEGEVIGNEGFPADIRVTERGLSVRMTFGRMFKLPGRNPNSGFVFNIGAGYMQHKIALYDAENRVAAIYDKNKYGYDRLSGGLSISQFLGYYYLSENRVANFYFGIEASQNFLKSYRKYNYDTGLMDTQSRLDGLIGLKIAWIIPIYKRKPDDYYTY
jgi:hypothetical protein